MRYRGWQTLDSPLGHTSPLSDHVDRLRVGMTARHAATTSMTSGARPAYVGVW
jgi:hypothetical protein